MGAQFSKNKEHQQNTLKILFQSKIISLCIICYVYSKMYSSTLLKLFHNHIHHGWLGRLPLPSCSDLSCSSIQFCVCVVCVVVVVCLYSVYVVCVCVWVVCVVVYVWCVWLCVRTCVVSLHLHTHTHTPFPHTHTHTHTRSHPPHALYRYMYVTHCKLRSVHKQV